MNVFAGGRLAAAVSNAGGLGLIGGGYGDAGWLEQQFAAAGNARVGCGFITWSMARDPKLLEQVLARKPAALMLSFGELEPHASRIKAHGVPLICQVQGMKYLREAVDAGADIIVAEGCEAGGHSGHRGVFTLVPEAADYLAKHSPDTVLVAAGGVGDGRGLAAAIMLGADGVLVGTRFVASQESEASDAFRDAIIRADGDATIKTTSVDIARKRYWPNPEFVIRVLRKPFVAKWHGREHELEKVIDVEYERFSAALKAGDADSAGVLIGEVSESSGTRHCCPDHRGNDRAGPRTAGLAIAMTRYNLMHCMPRPEMHGLNGYLEVIDTVEWGLRELGHEVTRTLNRHAPGATNIIFGAHVFPIGTLEALPDDSIIYNFEQWRGLTKEQLRPEVHYLARRFRIWDYRRRSCRAVQPGREPRQDRPRGLCADPATDPAGQESGYRRVDVRAVR